MVAELVRYTDDGMGLDEAIAAYLAACEVEGIFSRAPDISGQHSPYRKETLNWRNCFQRRPNWPADP